ncbi:3-dehydroquinate synthase [Elizabethkingia anophelis]|uniref:3-dehydroquinate synthase n=1 Tax=Elizabethkingia anophelis TaxID=1117645 RepID=A0AAU8UYX6_9FLAO|nr:3-dehydroquinate synthase [Elizabethkingia anophelis]AQW95329.1 3-dehydroquinate synthase [Elizabethkingia anophelis]AQX03326.1 3-dehydroquinate synthase [Elizabethkingia anophelis]MCT3697274.1 3-dehydroquinate synthase [Elizabethkingia anophelis]MCT3732600.1 3-dehydroquinate synthase [Elizabethkingia anophelis]MDV3854526.1 3-dehydroquinate synthase [Elizabethkingia anophelis]
MISFLDDSFSQLNEYIDRTNPSLLLLLVDENTHEYCLPTVLANLETTIPFEIIEIEAGEEGKNIGTAAQLWEILSEFGTDRNALMINIGGGVITDMGGFVASTYKRGIKFINIPTTLLSMVDASIGGKTGIDHQFYKNIIGTFALPEKIFAYPKFLQTLPFTELRSGFAEMLKHGLIASDQHWNNLKQLELTPENIEPFVVDSMNIKQYVVEQDFKEQNLRKTLNFGHTIGHAIESLFLQQEAPVPHGEAVAAGMIMEAHLSYSNQLINEATLAEITNAITAIYPYLSIDNFSHEDIYNLMLNDKKNSNGIIKFSIIDKIGHCLYDYEVTKSQTETAIQYYKEAYKS